LGNIFRVEEVHAEALLDSFVLFDLERGEIFQEERKSSKEREQ